MIACKKNNHKLHTMLRHLIQDKVFCVAFSLVLITSLFSPPSFTYLDWKVLISLFNLMLVIQAFQKYHILDKIAILLLSRYTNLRALSMVLILLTFFSAMLVTNDVALITFVPLALILGKKANFSPIHLIIFQTLAANIGSTLTPMGNPQNLFLLSYYDLSGIEFFKTTFPFTLLGLLWLIYLNHKTKEKVISFSMENIIVQNKKRVALYGILFLLVLLSVFELFPFQLIFVLLLGVTLIYERNLLKRVDYMLLVTFVCFFLLIGNISNFPIIKEKVSTLLQGQRNTYLLSILLSQFISNVPCAILLSGFTTHWKSLLLGVNVGGLGTLIASLASVISYKLYMKENPLEKTSSFLLPFTKYNVLSLCLFIPMVYFFL